MKNPFKISVANVSITAGSWDSTVKYIIRNIHKNRSIVVLPCSLNDLAHANNNIDNLKAYSSVDIATTDGMPLVWWCKIKGHPSVDRVYGPDLMKQILKDITEYKYTQIFFGSTHQTLLQLKQAIRKSYPKIRKTHFISPIYFQNSNDTKLEGYLKNIKRINPAILWLGINSPKQVLLASRWKSELPHTAIICVGAAFDLITGSKLQAPLLLQSMGLEWLFRLITEPKRLSQRYLFHIPLFLMKQAVSKLRRIL